MSFECVDDTGVEWLNVRHHVWVKKGHSNMAEFGLIEDVRGHVVDEQDDLSALAFDVCIEFLKKTE